MYSLSSNENAYSIAGRLLLDVKFEQFADDSASGEDLQYAPKKVRFSWDNTEIA